MAQPKTVKWLNKALIELFDTRQSPEKNSYQ